MAKQKKKSIVCPKILDGCGTICIEVGHAICYPKEIVDHPLRIYHEYRYVCPNCGKEWIHDTLDRVIYEVPENAQFHIRLVNGKEVFETKDQRVIEHLRLKPQKQIKLTSEEFEKLIKRKGGKG